MAYKITDECLSCGACEPECPNQAISEGSGHFVINPDLCTECVGANESPKCADVCAVGAPKPDESRRETKRALLAKWERLHPGKPPRGLVLRADPNKPVIALVADGSPDPAGQKALENLDTIFRNSFPDYDVCWAFQAKFMIEGLKRKGQNFFFARAIPMFGAGELFKALSEWGVRKAAVQLLMMHESSFSKDALEADRRGIDLKFAMPFLSTPENRIAIIRALEKDFADGKNTATVLVGHGVLKDFEYNNCFIELDNYLRQHYRNVYCGTLHGPPGTEKLVLDIKRSGCQKVRFISLMLTTSEHISLDVMGDAPESWRSQIGLPAEVIDNLAENPVVRDFFVRNLKTLVAQF